MEPFRHLVERTALSAVNKKHLKPDDFSLDAENTCRISNAARKTYLVLLSEAFERPFRRRGESESYKLNDQVRRQNLRLIGWIRGKLDRFEPFRMH